MINNELTQDKINYLNQFSGNEDLPCVSFLFHGIEIELYSNNKVFLEQFKLYLPPSWLQAPTQRKKKVFHFDLSNWDSKYPFDEEHSSLPHFQDGYTIQRDFVAKEYIENDYVICSFQAQLDDGLHNFFRWYLSPQLIPQKKAMIHSAAILSENEDEVLLFFGPSGAGKTTVTELSSPRKVLSDDMNVLHYDCGKILCSPGGVGGLYKPEVSIDKKYPVKSIYWLVQDQHFEIKEINKKEQFKLLLSSLANLPLGSIDKGFEEEILELSSQILSSQKIQAMHFPKSSEIWMQIDKI